MPLFKNLRESVGTYWSPKPSKPQSRTPRSSSLDHLKARLDREGKSASPSKRTAEWLRTHSAEIKTPKVLSVKGAKVVKPPVSDRQAAKGKERFWAGILPNFLYKQPAADTLDDIDGATLLADDGPDISADLADLAAWGNEPTLNEPATPRTEKANASLIAPDEEDTLYQPTADDLRVMKTWSSDEVWTFHKLNNRGFEPLLPETWAQEFVTVPDDVFSKDDSEVYVKTHKGNEYNGRSLDPFLLL